MLATLLHVVWIDAAQVQAAGKAVTCGHPFDANHPLLDGFLRPWANGITVDSRGALTVDLVHDPDGAGDTPCRVEALDGDLAEALSLPFVASTSSEKASRAIWHLVMSDVQDTDKLLATVLLGPSVVLFSETAMRPLPGGLEGVAIEVPTGAVGSVIAEIGAQIGQAGSGGGAVRSVSDAQETDWIVTFDAGRALSGIPFVLRLSAPAFAALSPVERNLITQIDGEDLSAAAGRALDRHAAVVRERAATGGTLVPLAEDRVGDALDAATAARSTWASNPERQDLLRRLERAMSNEAY